MLTQYAHKEKAYTLINVFEVYRYLLREQRLSIAEDFAKDAQHYCVSMAVNDMVRAARMKTAYARKDFSMADCIGYVVSQRLGMKFLTGDKAFEGLPNVELVF